MPPLCAFGCPPNGAPMHRFPNPEKFPEKFEAWVSLVGGKLENASDYEFHRKRRMCSIHFTDADRNRNSRLNALAVPSLHLPGKSELRAADKTVQRIPQADDSVGLPETSDSARSRETDDHAEADTFDNDDSPPSPEPEIAAAVQDTKPEEKIVFSWQKTELIETDDTEDLTPEPASDESTLRDDAVTLSSFCEQPEPPSVTCEPAAAPAPEVVENLCQVCGAVENGYYYWCVSCGAGALCGACAASLAHELHFVLRAPTGAPKEQTQSIIAVLRQQLENENLLRLFETEADEMKVEVKQEPEELPILHLPEPEPDPLGHLDPLAGLSEPFVNPEVPQEQIEVTVTEGSTEEDTDRLVSETMASDVDVEFVRETIDHHQFKRPRLMDHRQSIKPATKNVQLPLIKHPNVIGSQSIISNPAESKTVLQVFQSKQDIIKNLRAKGFQPINPKITRVEYRKMLKHRRQNPNPEGFTKNTSKVTSVPNKVVAPVLTEETTVDLDEIQFLDQDSEYQDLLDKVTPNETDENESNRVRKQTIDMEEIQFLDQDSEYQDLLDKVTLNETDENKSNRVRKQTIDLEEIQFQDQRKEQFRVNQTVKSESNSDIRRDKNKTNDISDTESVLFTDDYTDKEYRIDVDDISDGSMDWDGVNVSDRGVGGRTRNATNLVVKGSCEAMLRSLPTEATVTLTSLEISKWTADRKRRKED